MCFDFVRVWFRALAANGQNMALAQRHAEALIWLCLAPSAVAEPESCFARLRQSPEPANKNKFSEIVWRHPLTLVRIFIVCLSMSLLFVWFFMCVFVWHSGRWRGLAAESADRCSPNPKGMTSSAQAFEFIV